MSLLFLYQDWIHLVVVLLYDLGMMAQIHWKTISNVYMLLLNSSQS